MVRAAGVVAVLVALELAPAGHAASSKPITGSLSKRGYTVIALAADGRARSVVAAPRFRLAVRGTRATLHLRDARGRYAGPVVVGGSGKRVVVGVRAGAHVGRVQVRRGYARAVVKRRFLDRSVTARARKGVPLGAGKLGRVRLPATGKRGTGRDLDLDGIPGAFDVDDDGDLALDNVDRSQTARAALHDPGDPYHPFWIINSGLQISCISDQQGVTQGACGYPLNRNGARAFADSATFGALVDTAMKSRGTLFFPLPAGENIELDCGGLTYCKRGGTGFFHTRDKRFPDQFDADGDGFGTMTPVPAFHEGQDGLGTVQSIDPETVFGLAPMAGAAAIRAGDTYIERVRTDGRETERPVTLGMVLGALPTLAYWRDPDRTVTIGYPTPTGAEGSESNAFTVKQGADGDYRVTLGIWRPQRPSLPGELSDPARWVDIGGLTYTVVGKTAEQNRRLWRCPAAAYSTNDPNLTTTAAGVVDRGLDRQEDAGNTLELTVDLSECYRASGLPAFDTTTTVFVTATSAYGDAAEGVGFSFKPLPAGGVASSAFGGSWSFAGGAPGNQIEWTATANSASTSHFLITTYDPFHVVSGTAPPGWTCAPGRASRDGDALDCSGGTLGPGQSVSGSLTLDQPGHDGMTLDLVVCSESNVCQGFGMTHR